MDELEHIKKVESEVADLVDKAKARAEKRVNEARSAREGALKAKVEEANAETDKKIKKAKESAEKETAEIKKSIGGEKKKFEDDARKHMESAVEMVLKEFKDIH